MIGHGGLLRAFSFGRPIRGSGGSTPRHAQTAVDLGFAVRFNTETVAFRSAPLSRVG